MRLRTAGSAPVNKRRLIAKKQREHFLAKLSSACVLLLGTTAMDFAWAAKTAPASHHSGRAASTRQGNPVTSRSALPRSHHVQSRSRHILPRPRSHRAPTGVRLILVSRS